MLDAGSFLHTGGIVMLDFTYSVGQLNDLGRGIFAGQYAGDRSTLTGAGSTLVTNLPSPAISSKSATRSDIPIQILLCNLFGKSVWVRFFFY